MLVDLAHPLADFGERVPIGNVVGDYDSMSAAVVARRDGLEPVLTSCVPNLQLDVLSINLDRTNLEVDANRRHEVLMEDVICKSQQQRRLANARISNQKHLEQVIASIVRTLGSVTY